MSDLSWSNLGLGTGGGATVGVAKGVIRITLDESAKAGYLNSVKELSTAGQNVGKGVQLGVQNAEKSLNSLGNTARQVGGTLLSAFAFPALVAGTQRVQRLNMLMVALSGSQERANERMEAMRNLADRTGQSFLTIAEGATALLPAIGRNNVDLEQTLLLAQRLAILDPAQGIEGASFAIREILSGTYTSLAMRFEMSKTQLKDLVAAAKGDPQAIINGLDQMVGAMGITEESITQMGESGVNSFAILRDEVVLTTAQAFEPMLNDVVIPLVQGFGDLVRQLREVNPELLTMAGTMVGIAATTKSMQFAGVAGAGKVGLTAAAAYGGVELGVAGARAAAETGLVNRPDLENVSQDEARKKLLDTLKMAVVAAADTVVSFSGIVALGGVVLQNIWGKLKAGIEVEQARLDLAWAYVSDKAHDFADGFVEIMQNLRTGVADLLGGIAAFVNDIPGMGGAAEQLFGASNAIRPRLNLEDEMRRSDAARARDENLAALEQRIGELRDAFEAMGLKPSDTQAAGIALYIDQLRKMIVGGLKDALMPTVQEAQQTDTTATGIGSVGAPTAVSRFTDEQIQAWQTYQEDLAEIESNAQEQREESLKSHESEKTKIEKDYQDSRDKIIKDASDSQTEAFTKLGRDIAQIEADRDKALKAQQDNFAKEEIEQQRKKQLDLQKLNRDYWNTVFDAALHIDARAIFNATRDYLGNRAEMQSTGSEEARIRQQENQDRQTEIRQQATDRIAGLQQQYALERAEIEKQKGERLAQLQAEHLDRLTQENAQHAERMAQLDAQTSKERSLLESKFIQTYNSLAQAAGQHQSNMIRIQQAGQQAMEQQLAAWLTRQQHLVGQYTNAGSPAANRPAGGGGNIRAFASGGDVWGTGIALVHDREHMINAPMADRIRRLNPDIGDFINRSLRFASTESTGFGGGGGAGGKSISIGSITVPINGDIGNWSKADIGEAVRDEFVGILEEYLAS